VLAVVGFARAIELLERGELVVPQALSSLRDELWLAIREQFPEALRNGSGSFLPNTLNVCFPGADASEAQGALAELGFSVAVGAAANRGSPSHVLTAMGLEAEHARASLRFSLGRSSSSESVRALVAALVQVLPSTAPNRTRDNPR
jgi:cysteine desulfurase